MNTTKSWMSQDAALVSRPITAWYSVMLLVAGPIQVAPELTRLCVGEYKTQAAEARFRVWWQAPSANP